MAPKVEVELDGYIYMEGGELFLRPEGVDSNIDLAEISAIHDPLNDNSLYPSKDKAMKVYIEITITDPDFY